MIDIDPLLVLMEPTVKLELVALTENALLLVPDTVPLMESWVTVTPPLVLLMLMLPLPGERLPTPAVAPI